MTLHDMRIKECFIRLTKDDCSILIEAPESPLELDALAEDKSVIFIEIFELHEELIMKGRTRPPVISGEPIIPLNARKGEWVHEVIDTNGAQHFHIGRKPNPDENTWRIRSFLKTDDVEKLL